MALNTAPQLNADLSRKANLSVETDSMPAEIFSIAYFLANWAFIVVFTFVFMRGWAQKPQVEQGHHTWWLMTFQVELTFSLQRNYLCNQLCAHEGRKQLILPPTY